MAVSIRVIKHLSSQLEPGPLLKGLRPLYCNSITYSYCFNHKTPFFSPLQGKATQSKKRPWQKTKVQAVERQMKKFITSCIVPGKMDCEKCWRAEPEALKNRDWQTLHFYVYNRISASKRKLQCNKLLGYQLAGKADLDVNILCLIFCFRNTYWESLSLFIVHRGSH